MDAVFAAGAASLWFTPDLLFAPVAGQGQPTMSPASLDGALQSRSALAALAVTSLVLAWLAARVSARRASACAIALLVGLLYAQWQAAQSLAQMLPAAHDRDEFLVEGVVRGVVTRAPLQKYDGSSAVVQRFDFQLTALRQMLGSNASQMGLGNAGLAATPARDFVHSGLGQPRRLRLSSYGAERLAAGQSWRLLVRLRSPRGLANPGSFDAVRFMLANHIDAYGYVREKFTPTQLTQVKPIALPARLAVWLQALRAARYQALQPLLQQLQHPAIYNALLLGEKSTLPAPQKLLLQRTGTAHLLAISGLHIGLAAGLGMLLGRLVLLLRPQLGVHLPAPHWLALCSLPLAFFYAVLAGLALPTQRALIMLLSFACANLCLRHVHPFNHLVIALACVLLMDPLAVLASGMWLSFAAVALLISCFAAYRHSARLPVTLPFKKLTINLPAKLSAQLPAKLSAQLPAKLSAKLSARLARKLSTSTAQPIAPGTLMLASGRKLHAAVRAQLAIFFGMPLVLAGFGLAMPVVAPLANLIVVPIVGLWVVPAGIMALLLSYLSADAALVLLQFADLGLHIVLNVLEFLAGLSALQLGSATLSRWVFAAAALAAIAVLLGRRRAPFYGLAMLAWVLLFNPFDTQLASARRIANSALQDGDFVLTQFDVGQGSAVLISTRQQHWLYDTGGEFGSGDAGRAVILPALRRFGIAALDGAIVSHGDKDHAGGVSSLAAGIPVAQWFFGGSASDALDDGNAAVQSCTAGWQMVVDRVVFEFIHPPRAAGLDNKENDRSCVLKVSSLSAHTGSGSALFPGDISRAVERQLVRQFTTEKAGEPGFHGGTGGNAGVAVAGGFVTGLDADLGEHAAVAVDVLVVPHHGSKTSSSEEFLDALRPRYALVSAGFNNRYRHPHPVVERRYVNRGIRFLRSDELGAIQLAYRAGRWQAPRCARYRGRFFWQRWDNTQRCAGTLHNP